MRLRYGFVLVVCLSVLAMADTAQAQYGARRVSDPATGETYHVELFGGFWSPTPDLVVASEGLEIAGENIDLVADLGVAKKRFRELRVVLRPARKHKFRLHYLPMTYGADTVLQRAFVFNGIQYTVGLPVVAEARWHTTRIGYEYDFIYRDRGFVGFIAEAKYTDVRVELASPLGLDFARARAPIPAIGGIGRVYVASNVGVTFEMTGIKLPERIDENYRAHYLDYDIYTTLNFSDNVGAQIGYRSIDVEYLLEDDSGNLSIKGFYFGGVVRF